MIELQDLKKGDKIKEPVYNETGKIGTWIRFDHCDGLYSFCVLEDAKPGVANVIHLSRFTPLKKVGSHYEISHQKAKVPKNKARKPVKVPVRNGSQTTARRNGADRQAR